MLFYLKEDGSLISKENRNLHKSDLIGYKDFLANTPLYAIAYAMTFILGSYISRQTNASFYGDFSLAIRFLLLATPFFLLGSTRALVKFFSQYAAEGNYEAAGQFLKWNIRIICRMFLLFCLLCILCFSIVFYLIHARYQNISHFHLAVYVQLIVPVFSLTILFGMYLLAFRSVAIANVICNAAFNIVCFIGFFILFHLNFNESHLTIWMALTIAVSSLICMIISAGILLIKYGKQLREYLENSQSVTAKLSRVWMSYSRVLLLNTVIYVLIQFIDLLIVELVNKHGEKNVGYYSAILVISNMINMISNIVRSLLTPRLSVDMPHTVHQRNLNLSNKFQLICILMGCLLISVFSKYILGLFGVDYVDKSQLLIIFVVGSGLSVLPSLCYFDPLYHGYPKVLLIRNFSYIILVLVLCPVSYYFYNLMGMVWCIVAIKNITNFFLFFYVSRRSQLKYFFVI